MQEASPTAAIAVAWIHSITVITNLIKEAIAAAVSHSHCISELSTGDKTIVVAVNAIECVLHWVVVAVIALTIVDVRSSLAMAALANLLLPRRAAHL